MEIHKHVNFRCWGRRARTQFHFTEVYIRVWCISIQRVLLKTNLIYNLVNLELTCPDIRKSTNGVVWESKTYITRVYKLVQTIIDYDIILSATDQKAPDFSPPPPLVNRWTLVSWCSSRYYPATFSLIFLLVSSTWSDLEYSFGRSFFCYTLIDDLPTFFIHTISISVNGSL